MAIGGGALPTSFLDQLTQDMKNNQNFQALLADPNFQAAVEREKTTGSANLQGNATVDPVTQRPYTTEELERNARNKLSADVFAAVNAGPEDINRRLAISGLTPQEMTPAELYLTYGPDIKNLDAFLDQRENQNLRTDITGRLGQIQQLQQGGGPQSVASILQQINPFQAANLGTTNLFGGATIDQSQQGLSRDAQQNLLTQLAAQAQGQGPSLASEQLKQATNRNLAQQMAALASQRGGNTSLAQRGLSQQAALAGQDVASQSALLRAQEQLSAQQQLAGLSSQMRGQDIGLAQSQAELAQQAGLSGMNLRAQEAAQRAQLEQAARAAGYQGSIQQAQTRAQFDDANRARNLQAALTTQGQALAQEQALRAQNLGLYTQGRQEQQQLSQMALQQILQEKGLNIGYEESMRKIAASKPDSSFFGDVDGEKVLSTGGQVAAAYATGGASIAAQQAAREAAKRDG